MSALPPIDRTAKLFIGGKQARPDGNYSRAVLSPKGEHLGEVGEGNRKDIRNAVAAARAAEAGRRRRRITAPRSSTTLPKIFRRARDEFAARIAAHDRRRRAPRRRRRSRPASSACSAMAPGPTNMRARSTCRRCAAWRSPCTSRSAWSASPVRTRRRCWLHQPGRAADRDGQPRSSPSRASGIRSPRPISTRCWRPRTCRRASSTSSPASAMRW